MSGSTSTTRTGGERAAPVAVPHATIGRPMPGALRIFFEQAATRTIARMPVRETPGTIAAEAEANRLGGLIAASPLDLSPVPNRVDFAAVRIHDAAITPSESHRANARAITHGRDVYIADGAVSRHGPALIAHELVHVLQQSRNAVAVPQRQQLDTEMDEQLKATTYDPKALDPNNEGYAQALQQLGFTLTHDEHMALLTKPPKKAEIAEWDKRFEKANILAKRILKAGLKVTDKETRAGLIGQDLAQAGFIDRAMAIAAALSQADQKAFIYEQVLKQPTSVSAAHVTTISQHFVKANPALDDHAVMKLIRDRTGAYSAALGDEKLKAVLTVVVTTYGADENLIGALSEVLIFNKKFRPAFATWIRAQGKAELLFRILRSKWFADEDQAEREEFADKAGKAVPLDRETDQGWVVSEKQRYYVDYLIGLALAQKVVIPKPADMTFRSIRAWLDANTGLVAQALKAAGDPAKAAQVYREIADVFFYHVSQDEGDVKPDLAGKLAKLEAATPQKKRLKADCDVLASYALRLLTGSGFTPIGYLAIVPTDTTRQPHVVGIVQHGKDYHFVSNKTIEKASGTLATPKAMLTAARDYGLKEAYDDPKPTSFAVYYAVAGSKGELDQKLVDADASLRRPDIEPSASVGGTP